MQTSLCFLQSLSFISALARPPAPHRLAYLRICRPHGSPTLPHAIRQTWPNTMPCPGDSDGDGAGGMSFHGLADSSRMRVAQHRPRRVGLRLLPPPLRRRIARHPSPPHLYCILQRSLVAGLHVRIMRVRARAIHGTVMAHPCTSRPAHLLVSVVPRPSDVQAVGPRRYCTPHLIPLRDPPRGRRRGGPRRHCDARQSPAGLRERRTPTRARRGGSATGRGGMHRCAPPRGWQSCRTATPAGHSMRPR